VVDKRTRRESNQTKEVREAGELPDFSEDYAEYQADAGIHTDPQFPVYSNWQRADDEVGNFRYRYFLAGIWMLIKFLADP